MTDTARNPDRNDRPCAYLIGLTGNIATGKSSVANMLRHLGAQIIDADKIAHEVMRAGTPVWQQIVKTFGEEILAPDGEINRAKLGQIVFADPQALARLERIVHPAVIAEVDRRIAQIATETAQESDAPPVIVVEAIKLIEAGMHRDYDALWVVTCPPEEQKARLMRERNLSEAEADLRIRAQPPAAAKIALADVVIENSGSLEDTRHQVIAAWKTIPRGHLDKNA